MSRPTPSERFWSKVDKNGPVHPVLGTRCWLWTGAISARGRGRFVLNGKVEFAPRAMYAVSCGWTIPPELCVCHKCDNPPCVRPTHHFIGTQADNVHDCVTKGRFGNQNTKKTRCVHGHEFSPENTWYDKNGKRSCRSCWRDKNHERSRQRSA